MRSNILLVFMLAVPILVISIFIGAAGFYYLTNISTDEPVDTNSIYVYVVDREFGELNRTYCKGSGIVPENETFLITYEDIPEIFEEDGVQDIYILDVSASNKLWNCHNDGETSIVKIPSEVVNYFDECSGMGCFSVKPASGEYAVFKCYTVTDGKECEDVAEPSSEEPDLCLYYKYDPATWDAFKADTERYISEIDGYDEVEMLITMKSETDSRVLQQYLMKTFPASNYESLEYGEGWLKAYNGTITTNITIAAVITFVLLLGTEVLLGVLRKPRKQQV
ncbi:MAG: hypothetical protein SPL61_05230 [Saccharofermentans sp.]|nr:hypothetical protein [Saccharofermentans sp.]